ncbi:MAG TPA: transketolase [Chlamydiales bacterium]|nr:transketolase [Chlamydiales bacterium]
MSNVELKKIASEIRYKIIEMSKIGKAPHLGSSLSCVDIIVAAYRTFLRIASPKDRLRDRFILSKGHAISTLYAVLASQGFFPAELLKTFNKDGGSLPEHPTPHCVPGVEMATGSLGHGLSVGIGQAMAGRILGENYRVMVLLSDGECNEGSVWEAALFAPARKLDNLIAIVDFNKWQATGRSEEIMQLSPLRDKWAAFGWQAYEIDGNNMDEIVDVFAKIPETPGKPTAIIAHTVKGKGVSFMEDDNNWHYRIPTDEDLAKAKEELGIA